MFHSYIRSMVARDPHEHHRAATALELLYDLVLVIPIATAAAALHHAISENHIGQGVFAYLFMFWTLWWPWVNFTWFASAYDNDDALYRCLVFVQMVGALMTAAGIKDLMAGADTVLPLAGYIVMRIGMIALWLRVAAAGTSGSACAKRYAIGIALCQIFWTLAFFLLPRPVFMPAGLAIMALEMAIPVWAERRDSTTWHRHHIVERYGLLVIIVLGESLLSGTNAIAALAKDVTNPYLWMTTASCFVILFAMWWLYFREHAHAALDSLRGSFTWGYGHFFIFVSAAATGAGIGVLIDHAMHRAHISQTVANAAVALPVAIYLMSIWVVHDCPSRAYPKWQPPFFAILIALTPLVSFGPALTAVLLALCGAARSRPSTGVEA